MTVKKAILRNFDPDNYTAVVEISGGSKAYLEGVKVANNLPAAEMSSGRNLAVIFFDDHNAKDAVVVAVYT